MKKVLSWVLLLTLVLSLFAGCRQQEVVTPTEPETTVSQGDIEGITAAMDYLKTIYKKTEEATLTPVDYSRFNIVRIGGVPYEIVWTVDVGEDLVKIIVNDDGTVTIDINENCEEDTPYVLTATITDAEGNSVSESWNMILPKAVDMTAIVDAAYELANGESLPYECRLRGKIISIDTIWSDDYQNITVTIAVEGREDKPIKCYRLKGDGAKDLLVGNIITVFGTIKNYNGTIEFDAGCMLEAVEKGDAVEAPTDPGQILKDAYNLAENAALPYPVTLTGIVTKIDSPYDPNYGNISVVIEVEGYSQYPILCYRLKGLGVDQIALEDQITVAGIIKNYKGTIEFDAGCQLLERVSGGNIAQKPSSDPNKIIPDALALGVGESLPYRATLTGEVYSIDTPYSSQYNNITVTIKVNGYKFQCYRMVGDGIDQIRETDTITVSGIIKNYNGKLEFDTKCTLDSWSKGPRNVNYGPCKEDVAYALYIDQKTAGKTIYFNGEISGTRLQTSAKSSKAVEVYAERVSGKGVRFYYMAGTAKKYIGIEEYVNDEGKVRGRAIVTDTPSCYWTYLSDYGVYAVTLPSAGKYFLGTYSSYETITASWSGYLDSSSNPQYVAKFMEFSKLPADEPAEMITQGNPVADPQVGVAYKFGLKQNKVEDKPFLAFNGKMAATYYFGTSNTIAEMVDVYLEAANGGYHMYFMNGNTKTYLDIIPRSDDASKVNVVMQTSGSHSVYTLNKDKQYVSTVVNGNEWYFGTYDDKTTLSASSISRITGSNAANVGVSQFCAWFHTVEMVEAPEEEPEVPTEPIPEANATLITAPQAGVAYKLGMDKGEGVLFFTGKTESGVSYRLETSMDATKAADVYLEAVSGVAGGYRLYFMNNGVKTYIRVFHRTDDAQGRPGFGKGSLEFVTSVPSEYFTYDTTAKTLFHKHNSNDSYYMGTYGEYVTVSVSNTSYITGNKASSVDVSQFPVRFYTVDISDIPATEPPATEPPATEPIPDADATLITNPAAGVAYKMAMNKAGTMLYFNGMTESPDVSYRLQTTENPAEAVDVYLEDAGSGNVYLYFMNNGVKTYIRVFHRTDDAQGRPGFGKGSLEFVTTKPSETFVYDDVANTLFHVASENDSYYLGTYGTYTTFSVSNTSYITGDKAGNVDVSQFPARFYTVDLSDVPVVTQPVVTEPVATEPAATEPPVSGESYVTEIEAGVTYKWGIDQKNKGTMLYFAGTMNGYYGATTENFSNGVDVVLEATNGGYHVSFTDASGAKKYINVVISGTHKNFTIADSASTVYTWNAEYATLNTVVDGATCYIGTYGTYNTFSVSTMDKIGTSFPSHFYATEPGDEPVVTEPVATEPVATEPVATEPPVSGESYVTEIAAGVTYKWGIDQKNKGTMLYFAGTMNGYYGATTENFSDGVDVVLEATNGGYHVSFTDASGAKKYINVVISGTHKNFTIANSASTVYTWNAEYATLNTVVDGATCYIGTYGTYNTFSVSTMDKIGTSFPSHFYAAEPSDEPVVTEPVATEPAATEPAATEPPVSGTGYVKVTSAAQLTSGKYVMIVSSGYAPGVYESGWLSAVRPVVSGNVVTDPAGGVWNVEISGNSVTFTDANGVTIAPKGGNYNGVIEGDYQWTWSFESDGTFKFAGVGSDTVVLASNATTTGQYPGNHRFRGYKTTTVTSQAANYPCNFTLYKLSDGADVPVVTEPAATEPVATEPAATEPPVSGESYVTEIAAGVTYKWGIDQKNKGTMLYFAGTMNGYYGATTENFSNGVDVVLEATNGGYHVSFTDASGAKKYINVVISGTHKNFTIADSASTVYTWNAEYATLNTVVDGATCYIGTYGTYNTFSVSTLDKIGTSFPSHFYATEPSQEPPATEPPATEPPASEPSTPPASGSYVTSPVAGKAYKMAMNKAGTMLYFNGMTESPDVSYRLQTTENAAEAVNVYLEDAGNGNVYLYFMNNGVKTYIRVFHRTDDAQGRPGYGKGSLEFVTTKPSETFVFDDVANTLFHVASENDSYYLGTYGTYTTFSVSNTSYITGNKAGNVDVSQFPARLYEVSGSTEPPATEPPATEPPATEPPATEPPAAGNSATYTFSEYTKGTQFAAETHELDSVVTLSIADCHLTTQLRLYQGAVNGVNRDGIAQFVSAKAVASILMNAGYKATDLLIYASKDGSNWELVKTANLTVDYADHSVELPEGTKYIKLDSVSAQARIQYMTFTFAE